MTINIAIEEADRLTRKLAEIESVGLTEAIERRRKVDRMESAERLRAEFGITLTDHARQPLPRSFFDELSGDR